ncbi:MAG TPA: FliM/FliN family flagellar motor switch protein [Vicinamibacterales bacterium]|nr:FliM/FliN family flagellar motor switch protein [Vicinamibacterales bacterium]
MNRDHVINRFAAELTKAAGAAIQAHASSRPGAELKGSGVLVNITSREADYGTLLVFFSDATADALTRLSTSAQDGEEVGATESVRRLCALAAAGLDRRAPGCDLIVTSIAAVDEAPEGTSLEIVLSGQEQPLQVVLGGTLEFPETPDSRKAARSRTLDVIMDINLPLVVRFGRTQLPLRTLTTLGPGSVIDLGRSPDEPVEILISNRVVARGEVLIMSGNYGVRIQEVVSPAERARSLEAELS